MLISLILPYFSFAAAKRQIRTAILQKVADFCHRLCFECCR